MLRRIHKLLLLPLFLFLFVSLAFAANIYVDVSCTNNGDGTDAACATSDGGVGAYNNLSDPLANATSGDIIWLRRGNSNISVSSTLSPTNDGTEDNPIKLVGWPYYEQVSGTVDGAISGKEKFGFYDAELTATDKGHYCSAEIEFTSGSNNGLKRKVIFYQYDSANSRGEVYVFPDLPNNIAAGDQYTITLETELWNDRPQSGQDAGWDNDDYVRPWLSGGSFHLWDSYGDLYWHLYNLGIKDITDGYYGIYRPTGEIRNIVGEVTRYGIYLGYKAKFLKDIYFWGLNSAFYAGIQSVCCPMKDIHLQGDGSGNGIGLRDCEFSKIRNLSLGKVFSLSKAFYRCVGLKATPFDYDATTLWHEWGTAYSDIWEPLTLGEINGDDTKLRQFHTSGEIYNVDEDATIDPPSGATTYIKLLPNSHCNSIYPLKFSFNRRQAASAKTYTFKVYIPSDCTTLSTSDIYADVWYLDESSGTHRKEETHNISTVNTNAWNDLSFSITPGQEGTVYIDIVLQKYESGCYIALDPKFSVE